MKRGLIADVCQLAAHPKAGQISPLVLIEDRLGQHHPVPIATVYNRPGPWVPLQKHLQQHSLFSFPLGIFASLLSLKHTSLRAFARPAPSVLNAPSPHGPVAPRLRCPSSKRVPDLQLKTVHPSISLFPLLCSVLLHVVSHSLTMNYTCFFIVCLPLQSKPHEGQAVTYLVHYYGSFPGSVPGTGSGLSRS